jgi:hypothetical protein
MPDYASLSTQIDAVKSEITASLNASTYTAQDLVFIASALDKLGSMLGVNDIVAATAAGVTTLTSTKDSGVTTLNNTRDSAIATINSTYLHPLFLIGV